jgi:hypothetical protein
LASSLTFSSLLSEESAPFIGEAMLMLYTFGFAPVITE